MPLWLGEILPDIFWLYNVYIYILYIYIIYIPVSLWIQVSLKKILWPANCTPIAFQAADPWIHRVYMVINICIIGTPWNSTPNGKNALLDQFQGSACSQTKMVLQSFSIVLPRLHRPLPRNGVIFFMPPSLGIVSYWAMAGEPRTFCISVIGNGYYSNQSGPRYYDLVASEDALAKTLICRGRNRFDKYQKIPCIWRQQPTLLLSAYSVHLSIKTTTRNTQTSSNMCRYML